MNKKQAIIIILMPSIAVLVCLLIFLNHLNRRSERIKAQAQYEIANLKFQIDSNGTGYTSTEVQSLYEDYKYYRKMELEVWDNFLQTSMLTFLICLIIFVRNYQSLKDYYRNKRGFKWKKLSAIELDKNES